jgi:DNA-binding SARP family transcriptional activator/TolB-like protein
MAIVLTLFGAPTVEKEGRPARGRAVQRRRLAILALLAASRLRTVSRDRAIGLLWPDGDTSQARKLLSEALYVIRRELGEDLLLVSGDDIELARDGVVCDLWRFEDACKADDADAAIAVRSAPFLAGWYVDDAPEYQRWVEERRSALEHEFETLLGKAAQRATADGEHARAARYWRRLVALDPLRTGHTLGLARALEAVGETGVALTAITEHERRLREDLELEIDPVLAAFAEGLRQRRPVGRRATTPPDASAPAPDVAVLPAVASPTAPSPVDRRRRTGSWIALTVASLAAAAIGWVSVAQRPRPSTLPVPHRVAILYFVDGSVEQDLGAVADNLTEDLIEQFVGNGGFAVVPVNAVRQLRDRSVDADSAARALEATTVVEGRVLRDAERIVVRVQVRDVATGAVIATTNSERTRDGLALLKEDVARDVAIQLRQRVGSAVRLRELEDATNNMRASMLVTRGNRARADAAALLKSGVRSDPDAVMRSYLRADSLYRQAEAEDPTWSRPAIERGWTSLDVALLSEGDARVSALRTAVVRADDLVARDSSAPAALELRAALNWTLAKALGPPLDHAMVPSAIADLERALDADSLRPRSWALLSSILWMREEPGRAELAGRQALDLDWYYEDAPSTIRNLISASILGGQPDSANAWCDRGRLHYPMDWQFTECRLTVMKYWVGARPDSGLAWRLVARLDSLDPPHAAAALGHAYAPIYRRALAAIVSGRAGDARRVRLELARARAAVAGNPELALDFVPDEVEMLLLVGDTVTAQARLADALARRPLLDAVAAKDPLLRALRGTSRGVRPAP